MPSTARRTATYDADVIAGAERVKTSSEYRRAITELAGHEPTTESAIFNDLAKIALTVVERRALEIGYRQVAQADGGTADDVDTFLEGQALAGFDYNDEEDLGPLLQFMGRDDS